MSDAPSLALEANFGARRLAFSGITGLWKISEMLGTTTLESSGGRGYKKTKVKPTIDGRAGPVSCFPCTLHTK